MNVAIMKIIYIIMKMIISSNISIIMKMIILTNITIMMIIIWTSLEHVLSEDFLVILSQLFVHNRAKFGKINEPVPV